MRIEQRTGRIIIIAENKEETRLLDSIDQTPADVDGTSLIRSGEIRISDGYGEVYLSFPVKSQ